VHLCITFLLNYTCTRMYAKIKFIVKFIKMILKIFALLFPNINT